MPRIGLRTLAVIAVMTAASATLAQEGIHWQHDIEAAKAAARQSNRLVLVHVWGDGCAPCKALESNVFNQPGVAGAIEQVYVPVKLNANEFPATAQGFGITRIPTDVIITPDGQVIGKMISPATPAAYVAEMTQVASRYHAQPGQAYQLAEAKAPQPKILNPAYADLTIGAPAVPPIPAPTLTPANPPSSFAPPATGSIPFTPNAPENTAANPYGAAPTMPAPAAIVNPLVGDRYGTPPGTVPATTTAPAAAPQPTQTGNPYVPYGVMPSPTAIPVSANGYATPPAAPVTQPATGYDTPLAAPAATMPAALAAQSLYPAATHDTTASTAPAKPQLPPGAPPLGFDGFCPVSMRSSWKWVQGDTKYGAIHRGRTYIFAGPQEQQQFLSNPDYYSPALAGADPVMAIDHKQNVPGLREHSVDFDNQFFLFSSEATLQQFTANPQRYVSGVRQAMGMTAGSVR